MKNVLITGATGFVGTHLTDYLSKNQDLELFGTTISDIEKSKKIKLENVDLQNYDQTQKLIQRVKPDQIYHLAAFTSPADSFKNPTPVVLGNIEMQMNLFNAVLEAGSTGVRILNISSAEVYGSVDESALPVNEQTEIKPISPYGVSKVAQDYLSLQYFLSNKMDIVRVRPFNHIGPAQTPAFAIASFASQIAKIEKGKQAPIIEVGNLSARRDFTDVRDIVRGYELLMKEGKSGDVYNIGSGKSHKIQELLESLLSMSEKEIEIKEDKSRLRPVDIPDIYCDITKINKHTGWSPKIPIEKTLKDTLDYWREIV